MASTAAPELDSPPVILICYDGSENAKTAIKHGGEILAGLSATVLTVWQPVSQIGAHAPASFPFLPSLLDAEEIDRANAADAGERAEQGAELAQKAGFTATALTCSQKSSAAETILAQADALHADAILIGSRGLAGLKSRMLGSVSHAVIQHADRPVIVVPSPKLARSRARMHKRAAHGEPQLKEQI